MCTWIVLSNWCEYSRTHTHAMNTAVMMVMYIRQPRWSLSRFGRDTKRPFPNGKWLTMLTCHRLTRRRRCIGGVWIDYCCRAGGGFGCILMESQYSGRSKRVWKIRWFAIGMKTVSGGMFTGREWQARWSW